jgi:hypothetical protein
LALRTQAEGTSAKISRKAAAYASIASSSYNGPRKGFTFSSYITLHQAAHNELLDLDEPVSKTKKVTDFLKGIRDPNLNTGKSIVLGDPMKLEDFEKCQQYLSMIVTNLGNQAKAERHVAMVNTGGGGGGRSLVDKIKGGSYTDEQFRSLSPEEKKCVLKLREEAKKKKREKRKAQKQRRAARLKSDREGSDEPTEETTEANAGAQFGGNGNRKRHRQS